MAAALAMFLASLSASGEEFFDFYIEPEELDDPELAEAFSILCTAFPNTGEARASDSTPENSDQVSTTPVEIASSDNPSDFRTTSRDCKMADTWGLNDNAGGAGGNTGDGWGTSDAAGGGDPWDNRNGNGGGGGDGADDGGDRNCFNCGQPGHNKSDCTEPPKPFEGTCKACGQEGHMRRDCPDAPPMTCRICNEPGHMRKDCPQKPPELCRNCHEEGHAVVDCKNPRKIDTSKIEDVDASTAWTQITEAASEREGFEVKEAIQKYLKHFPEMTYCELEESFRSQQMSIYLIATERALAPTHTNMDLQGNLDKKYTVQYRFSPKPERAREKASWPASPEENFARLADAGEPVSRLMQKCINCNELGHISKACPQDAVEKVRVTITCYNCGEEGHRVRDCPTPRVDKFACKNCGQSGHKVADCTEPRSAEGVECNKCHEMGHFSRDCPQGGGGRACHNCGGEGHISKECTEPRKIKCRNCDKEGHTARDCSKPEDITRVKCMNCGEMGHKKVKCPNAFKEDTDDFGAPDNNNTAGGDDGGWGAGGGEGTVTYVADTTGW